MREVADVHRELYAENADLYGGNVAAKIELCLAVTDAEYGAGLRARDEYRERMGELFDEVDLIVTPTLPFVAPVAGQDERELRGRLTLLTWPFNVLGAPALALPCGPAEDGLPASVQIAGRPGDDALVLAAGALLERVLKL
jgi:aspartyl-tRNA(Asn)/glutamyl-tRNA(Gln) amidotransferase subunit A